MVALAYIIFLKLEVPQCFSTCQVPVLGMILRLLLEGYNGKGNNPLNGYFGSKVPVLEVILRLLAGGLGRRERIP